MGLVTHSDSIDWYNVSTRVQLNVHDHDVRRAALRLLDRAADLIDNGEDRIHLMGKSRFGDWFVSDDISQMLRRDHLPFKSDSDAKDFEEAVKLLSRIIPQYPHSIESVIEELKRRESNPYPGCYGYTYVHGHK